MGIGAAIGAIVGALAGAGGFVLAGFTYGTMWIAGAAIGSLFDKPQVDFKVSSPTYSFGPIQNTKTQQLPVPLVYGRNRLAGNIIMQDFLDTQKTKQNMLIALGLGEFESISDVKVNELSLYEGDPPPIVYPEGTIVNPEGCSLNVYYGTPDQTADSRSLGGLAYPNIAYLAITLKASEKLSGNPTITSIVEGRKIWTPSGVRFSRNPAWIVYDILTGTYWDPEKGRNEPVGLGLPLELVDLESFTEAAAYCDELVDGEPRFTLDYVIDTQKSAIDHLTDILSCFRGALIARDKIALYIDKPVSAPYKSIGLDNIIEGSFTWWQRPEDEIYNRVVIEWVNPDMYWEQTVSTFENEADIAERGIVERRYQLYGITRAAQAARMGAYLLDVSNGSINMCQFGLSIKDSDIEVGDVIAITHDLPGWDNKWFRVIKLEDQEDDTIVVTASEYVAEAYNDRAMDITLTIDTNIPNPFDILPPNNLQATEWGYQTPSGAHIANLDLTWDPPDDASARVEEYAIYVTYDGKRRFQGTTKDTAFTVSNLPIVSSLLVEVEAVSVFHEHSTPLQLYTSIVGVDNPPSDVTGVSAELTKDGIVVTWDPNTDIDIDHYVVQLGTVWDSQPDYIQSKTTRVTLPVETAGIVDILVKAVDNARNESVNAAHASVDVPAPEVLWDVSFDSSEEQLLVTNSGDIIARLKVTITPLTYPYIDQYELQWKLSSQSEWAGRALLKHETPIEYHIAPVSSGMNYDVRVRSLDVFGLASAWNTYSGINIIGKTSPPDDVTNFVAHAARDRINLTWSAVGNLDWSHYEIREGASWDTGETIAQVSATTYQTPNPSNGPWWIKAVDTSGNYSVNAAQASIVVTPPTSQNLSAQTIDNNVRLTWSTTIGTFILDTHEIRRGSSLATAEVIGKSDKTFDIIQEIQAGEYTYWVVPIDAAGNEGNAASVKVSVDDPPDFVLRNDFQTDWQGYSVLNLSPQLSLLSPDKLTSIHDFTALDFDGVDDYVQLPDMGSFSSFTIEGWIKPKGDSLTGATNYLTFVGSSGGNRLLYMISDNKMLAQMGAGNHYSITKVPFGQWNHVAYVYNSATTTAKWYINGIPDSELTGAISFNQPTRIGAYDLANYMMNGLITEVRIWNVARTAQQIADWKDRTLSGDEPGLVGYWRAQETWKLTPETNTLPDLSGHGNDGNIYGAQRYTPTVTAIAPTANYSRDQLTAMGYNSRDDMIAAGLNYRAQPTPDTAQFVEIYDAGTVIASTNIRVTLDQTAVVGSVTPTVTISTRKTLSDAWTDFPAGQNPVFATNFRYVKVKVDYSKPAADNTSFLVLNELETVLSSKIKNDTGVAYVSANPTTVNFNVDFVDVQGITVTPQGTTPLLAVVDFDDVPHPTSFDVYLFNGTTGAPATGQVRWNVRGY